MTTRQVGVTPIRTVRIGGMWDDASYVATLRGEDVSDVLRAALDTYVRKHRDLLPAPESRLYREKVGPGHYALRTADGTAHAMLYRTTGGDAEWTYQVGQLEGTAKTLAEAEAAARQGVASAAPTTKKERHHR
jgi:hypothetical protein